MCKEKGSVCLFKFACNDEFELKYQVLIMRKITIYRTINKKVAKY